MSSPLTLQTLLTLVVCSLLASAALPMIYRRNPSRRKVLAAASAAVLLIVPWWAPVGMWTVPVATGAELRRLLNQPLPWLLLTAWWAVSVFLMVRSLAAVAHSRRWLSRLPPLADPRLEHEVRRLARYLGLRHPIHLRCGHTACASTLGAYTLVLPAAAAQWSMETRTAVLAHEITHLQRRDDRLLLAVRLLVDWYWWMPWLRSLRQRFEEAMEESCDDRASAALPSRAAYVAGVVHAARSLAWRGRHDTGPERWLALLGSAHLTIRANRLLERPAARFNPSDGHWTLLWLILVLLVGAAARPIAAPIPIPGDAIVVPLVSSGPADPAPPQVRVRSFVLDTASARWRALPESARDPMPVYPAAALERGLTGMVIVELQATFTRFGLIRTSLPRITSTDPSGLFRGAVERALARSPSFEHGAALRIASLHDFAGASLPARDLLLRQEYRFELPLPEAASTQ